MLMLLVEQPEKEKQQRSELLLQNCSSHLHLASIMNERTDAEKETFGSLPLNLSSINDIDRAIEIYMT